MDGRPGESRESISNRPLSAQASDNRASENLQIVINLIHWLDVPLIFAAAELVPEHHQTNKRARITVLRQAELYSSEFLAGDVRLSQLM